jgi:hypothetical protein
VYQERKKEGTDSNIMETIHVSRVHDSLKCHRNVIKEMNPLQVDNLINNKSVAIL